MQKKENHQFTIGEAIELLTKDKRISKGLNENTIKENWPKIVGNTIASHTSNIYLSGKTLTVYFKSSIVKNEMLYNKSKAIDLINEFIGYEAVEVLNIK